MAEYAVTFDVVRVTLVVGVVLSMLVYERTHLTTGGAIVPAYLALSLVRPLAVVVTIGFGYLTHLVVTKVVAPRRIIYGRRLFEVEVLVGVALILIGTAVAARAGTLDPHLAALSGIGFLVPGIIAHDMGRQRPGRTALAVLATTVVLAAFVRAYSGLIELIPGASETAAVQVASVLGYPRELLLLGVATSVLVGMLVYSRLGLRSGGFVTAAYLALVGPRWWDLLFTIVVAVLVWAIVVKVLMPRMVIFGRRKLSSMVLVGSLIAWAAESTLIWVSHGDYVPWRGLTVATLMVPALIANDAERQGWERTIWGTTLTSIGVYAVGSAVGALAAWGGWL
jgi:poly-gamma-glutamate biosynthesis protein PgsC/CapC